MEESRPNGVIAIAMRLVVSIDGKRRDLEIELHGREIECKVDGRPIKADVAQVAPNRLSVVCNGRSYDVWETETSVLVGGNTYMVSVVDPRSWQSRRGSSQDAVGPQKLTASMPGKVVRVLAAAGTRVQAGEGIVVLEAMKMQNEVRASKPGTVTAVLVQPGSAVNAGEVIATIE